MQVTFLGHAGLFIETRHGSMLCDPWFNPAYFGSWFPFPRNDHLDHAAFGRPDYLYVSHLHRDHFDPEFLARHVHKETRVVLPDFPVPFLRRELEALGFRHFLPTRHGVPHDLDGLEIAVFAMTTPADGPLGDSALVVADGSVRLLNQNDARPGDPAGLQTLGPFDAHFVQFSGAIWYPIVYDFPPEMRDRLAAEKRVNEMARARQYIEWIKAAHVFPCAGPPCFLDDGLFGLNDTENDPRNIFPDQRVFLRELVSLPGRAHLVVPGSMIDLEERACTVTQPGAEVAARPFTEKAAYLEEYRADWSAWLAAEHESWSSGDRDLVAELAAWFEPLMEQAPITCAGIAGNVILDLLREPASERSDPAGPSSPQVCIDFVERQVRPWSGEDWVYKVSVDARLIATLIDRRVEDWVNSLFLSCRFAASRPGAFNEYVMTFFKALAPERIAYVERSYNEARRADEFFERDGWRIERYCPHRQADLTRFGEIRGGMLTCSLHHWQFDLESGRCLTSDDRHLRCERVAGA